MDEKVSPVQPRLLHRSIVTIPIVVVLVLVGGMLVALNVRHHGFGGVGATGGKSCSFHAKAPAPVQFSQGAGQSGLYAAWSEGLYRYISSDTLLLHASNVCYNIQQ